jgi:peptide/nickel transport system permease protein
MVTLLERWFGDLLGQTRTRWQNSEVLLTFRQDRIAVASVSIILIFALGAIFASYLTPYPGQGLGEPNIVEKFRPPSLAHPFGTDNLGRDLLARILFGGRNSLSIGFLVVGIAVLIGLPLGAISGYFGGWIDEAIMRLTDIFLSFPPLLLAIAIAAALGPSFTNSMIAISITWWPWYARLVRAQAVSVRERSFIEAARGIGVKHRMIIARHILPNIVTPVLVQGTMDVGSAILTAASMSFIGLGPQPPVADWGQMVSIGRIYILNQPWFAAFPGLTIFLVTLAFNLLGDSVRDIVDPRTLRKF